jgi:tellurite resistance protein
MLWKFLTLWKILEDGRSVVEGIQFFWWGTCVATYFIFVLMITTKTVLYPDVFKAEVKHPVRFNFFCGPIIGLCMLMIAMPPAFGQQLVVLQIMWTTAFFCQAAASLVIYHRWLVSSNVHETAASPYILSLISWFLLSAAGTPADIDSAGGLPLRAMCFGVGSFFAVFTYPFILSGIYGGRTRAGTPASFLIIAPPSVAGMSIIGINGGYHSAAGALLGCAMAFFLLLVRMGPQILAPPRLLGVNWTYIFSQAAMSILAIQIAEHFKSTAISILALLLSSCATLVILIVAIRLGIHAWQVSRGTDVWEDPLVAAVSQNPQQSFCSPEANIEASVELEFGSEKSGDSSEHGVRQTPSETSFNGTKGGNGTDGALTNEAATASAAAAAVAAAMDLHEGDDDNKAPVIQSS